MGRHKKNQSLIKSEDSTILVQTNSIVSQIKNSKELSSAEKQFIADQFEISGALCSQEQRLRLRISELNAEISRLLPVMKKKEAQKLLKQIKLEQTMTNNKVVGFIEMLESKIEAGELSENSMLNLEANNARD